MRFDVSGVRGEPTELGGRAADHRDAHAAGGQSEEATREHGVDQRRGPRVHDVTVQRGRGQQRERRATGHGPEAPATASVVVLGGHCGRRRPDHHHDHHDHDHHHAITATTATDDHHDRGIRAG